ncbi:hypothetical protein ZIOFF_054248 [Zingiber officinale]|uniref:Uncharacterized protein n=1 Tax=Zingiber officinale TaxID=94328 RepID=A0A8J5F996_ZINOF|nr:hypothetical protein ZIOFF_054248 [Zingiber officinale]
MGGEEAGWKDKPSDVGLVGMCNCCTVLQIAVVLVGMQFDAILFLLEIESVDPHALIGLECKANDDWYKGSITEYNSNTKHHRVNLYEQNLQDRLFTASIESVIHRFYRYPSESALSPEPPVSFITSVGFSVANIRNGFEPVQ